MQFKLLNRKSMMFRHQYQAINCRCDICAGHELADELQPIEYGDQIITMKVGPKCRAMPRDVYERAIMATLAPKMPKTQKIPAMVSVGF